MFLTILRSSKVSEWCSERRTGCESCRHGDDEVKEDEVAEEKEREGSRREGLKSAGVLFRGI